MVPEPRRIQREGAQLQIRGTWSAGPGDDQARFLADLRALRDSAAIAYDELAARAHYPSNILKEAENGPALPTLPILSAYVRACEGDVLDWEERWRRLNPDVADDPGLPVRPAGASEAAVAGARAGVSIAPPDVYDPERIKAALRGNQGRTEKGGRRASDLGISAPAWDAGRPDSPAQDRPGDWGANPADIAASAASPSGGPASGAGWEAGSGWDTAPDPGIATANGNHLAEHGVRGPFEAAFTSTPEPEPAAAEEFSWLTKGTPEAPPADDEPAWREQPESAFNWPEHADAGQVSLPAAEAAPPQGEVTERMPRLAADGLAAQERADFWSKPVASVPADLQRPVAAPRAGEPAIARASWTVPADASQDSAHRAADTAGTTAAGSGLSGFSGAAQPHGSARPAAPTAVIDRNRRKDRLFPVRLLMVIVIAALIGSALVLLLR